jgi:hypothetical protein
MGNMTTRHLGFAVFSLCLAVYVPACEYDPATGAPAQPQSGSTYSRLDAARPRELEPAAIDASAATVHSRPIDSPPVSTDRISTDGVSTDRVSIGPVS